MRYRDDRNARLTRRISVWLGGAAIGDWLSPLSYARRTLAAHFALASNAGAMAFATIANGALGFVYWWIAARFFTPSAVGFASADISLICLFSLAADLGFSTLLMGEIPRQRGMAPHLISAALLASLASAGAFGAVYLALTAAFAPSFGLSGGVPFARLLVFVGIGAQTASAVVDSALIGVLNAPLRLFRNLLFAFTKLLIVVLAALSVPENWQLNAIIASWVTGQVIALLALAGLLRFSGARVWYRPKFDLLRGLFGTAIWYYALDLVALAPALILPVIIAIVLSPEQNAAFYSAWMLLNLAGVVPAALATVLFTVGSRESTSTTSSVRFSLVVSLGIGVVAALGFWLISSALLYLLNPVYADLAGSDLRFLGASVPLAAVKFHYITVQRLDGRMRQAAFALAALGAIEVLFAGLGAEFHGLLGATTGWLLAMAIEASCLWPAIRRHLGGEVIGIRAAARKGLERLRPGSAAKPADEIAPSPSSAQGGVISTGNQRTQRQAGAQNTEVNTAMEQAMCGDAVIDVSIETLQDIARLETAWKELERRAEPSFYLSWLWIGTWLRHLPDGAQPHVLTARTSNKIVGLAIICRRRAWSFGLHTRVRWLLNETGVVRFDRRLWIEHNNILAERPSANAVRAACLDALTHRLRRSDQLVLSGIDPELELAAYRTAERAGLVAEASLEETAWWIDFAEVRQKGGIYRATLGSNSRYAVSRAMRLYAERGPVEFRTMETIPDALVAFDLLVELHQTRWGRRGPFVNPSIRRFHEELIARGVPTGRVRISRTLAGNQTIGVLYNFVHDGRVLNYQSGFLYECDSRLKPGLISHVLAIEDSIARGERGYDFMSGYAGHKPRLANSPHAMNWIAVGGDSTERRIEATLRRAKQSLSRAKRALTTIAA